MNEQIMPVKMVPGFSVGVQLYENHGECVDQKIADMEKMLKRMESIYDRFDRKWGDEMDANHVRIPGDLFCKLFFEMQDMVEYFRWIQKQKGIPQFNYNSVEEVEQ